MFRTKSLIRALSFDLGANNASRSPFFLDPMLAPIQCIVRDGGPVVRMPFLAVLYTIVTHGDISER